MFDEKWWNNANGSQEKSIRTLTHTLTNIMLLPNENEIILIA